MSKQTVFKQIVAAVLLWECLSAQATSPERIVKRNVITSQRDPSVRIQLPKSVQYVGPDRWVLFGSADCELHAFVETDGHQNVRRLYWVQFEGYVPARPELKHQYNSPRHVSIGGMDFYVDTWVRPKEAAIEPGSDREHIEALVRGKGYNMPAGMMYIRLVHLLDEQMRKELMIIYGEDVAPTGFTTAELDTGGKAHNQWPPMEKGLIERAMAKIFISSKAGQ